MMPRRVTLALALCPVLVLAGCTVGPTDSTPTDSATMTVEYTIQNEAAETYDVALYVLPSGLTGAEVVATNGTMYTVSGTTLGAIDQNITGDAVVVRPTGENAETRSHTVASGTGLGSRFEAVPDEATLVTVLRGPGQPADLRSWSASSCGDGTTTMTETIRISENGSVASSLVCSG